MKEKENYGILTVPQAYLYTEDLTEVSDELLMGWAVAVTDEMKECDGVVYQKVWTHYGYDGYLCADAFCTVEKTALQDRDADASVYVVQRAFVDVLAEPRVQGRIRLTLSRGSFVRVLMETENGYYYVETADGTNGYLPCVALERRRDNDGYLYAAQKESYFQNQKIPNPDAEEAFRARLVTTAKQYLGVQYRWGGKSAAGVDCSGLTFMSYQLNGILIYRDAEIREDYPVHAILLEQMQKGDLIYFKGHIAMYLGDHKYIHCTGHKNSFGCVINSLDPNDPDYREDLAAGILAVGSIFPTSDLSKNISIV
ncbi:MAG: NlpC/P60 family protein [Lachnospiraceae bacterium]